LRRLCYLILPNLTLRDHTRIGPGIESLLSGDSAAAENLLRLLPAASILLKMRCIAAIVCALYLSVSTIVGAIHHHSAGSLDHGDKCAACLWHAESVSDIPSVSTPVEPPSVLGAAQPDSRPALVSIEIRETPNRGPPSASSKTIGG
jgi:hypothetical protein